MGRTGSSAPPNQGRAALPRSPVVRPKRKLCLGILVSLALSLTGAFSAELWISPTGSDQNPGSREQPFSTLSAAQRKARELRRLNDVSAQSGIRIVLEDGIYLLTTPLLFRSEDSGTPESPTIIEAAPNAGPTLSGGVPVTGWKKAPRRVQGLPPAARGNVWMAEAPRIGGRVLEFRQLWINDRKAVRARNPNGALDRMMAWDRTNQFAILPTSSIAGVEDPSGVEMIFHQQWEIAICRLKSRETFKAQTRVTFHEPESQLQFEHPWPQPVMSSNGAPFFLAILLRQRSVIGL